MAGVVVPADSVGVAAAADAARAVRAIVDKGCGGVDCRRSVGQQMDQSVDTYGIGRIDQPEGSTHGWQVRIQRRGIKYAKYFADRRYGGSTAAYEASRMWRDRLLMRLAEEESVRICRRSNRNSSGVVGVCRVAVKAANGASYFFWQATWSPEAGVRRCVKFSVQRHGEHKAFELAVHARRHGVNGSA